MAVDCVSSTSPLLDRHGPSLVSTVNGSPGHSAKDLRPLSIHEPTVTYIRDEYAAAWIAEYYDLDLDQVASVVEVEFEYMVATGIAVKPLGAPDWESRYYNPRELEDAPASIDTLRIARDAERLAAVPVEVGLRALEAELDFLRRHDVA
jgi:hypothetical protein